MTRPLSFPICAFLLILLPGCSHPAPVSAPPAAPPPKPPPVVMPAPITLGGGQSSSESSSAETTTPASTIVDEDGDTCHHESDVCQPQGKLVNGRTWPYHTHLPDSPYGQTPDTPAQTAASSETPDWTEYNRITAEREDIQEQESAIYGEYNQCPDGSDCRANMDARLEQLQRSDVALSSQQSSLIERLRSVRSNQSDIQAGYGQ